MQDWHRLDHYFAVGSYYGEGLEGLDIINFTNPNPNNFWFHPGHGGADYGSMGFGGYFEQYGFSYQIAMNSAFGLNATLSKINPQINLGFPGTTWCYVLNTLLQ